MKKRDVLVNGIADFVFLFLACVFARIFSNMAVKLADLFVEQTFLSASGIRAVTLMLFSSAFIFFFSYLNGYHTVCFDPVETPLAALVAVVPHFIISFFTVFSPWIAGATKHISGFIAFGTRYTKAEHMKLIPMATLVLIGLLTAFIYCGLIVLGKYVGSKKRLAARAELMGKNTSDGK